MSLIFIRPGSAMGLGDGRLALYAPLSQTSSGGSGSVRSLLDVVSETSAWWDASSPAGLMGPGNDPSTTWNTAGNALIDKTGNGSNLVPFYSPASATAPLGAPHLSGLLGGIGFPSTTSRL